LLVLRQAAPMSLAVHLLREPTAVPLGHMHAKLRQDVILTTGTELPQPAAYQILVAGRPARKHITASPDLRALIVPCAGLPRETRLLMLDFPRIAVRDLHHNAVAAAEMAITLMLAAAKSIVSVDRALRQHDWSPRYRPERAIVLEGTDQIGH